MKTPVRLPDSAATLTTLFAAVAFALPGMAQIPNAFEGLERTGKMEIYGIGQFLSSSDLHFNGPNSQTVTAKMDDTGLGGFGLAYHFSDFFSVHGDFMFGNATFSGNVPLETGGGSVFYKQDAFIHTGRFNIDYNIINRRITPFVTAGIGYQYTEVELENLPPVNTCWWDPWWGWICYSQHPHAWQTDFTWNAGAGIRWSITDSLIVKVMGGATWLEYDGTHGITTQLEGVFSIGWSF